MQPAPPARHCVGMAIIIINYDYCDYHYHFVYCTCGSMIQNLEFTSWSQAGHKLVTRVLFPTCIAYCYIAQVISNCLLASAHCSLGPLSILCRAALHDWGNHDAADAALESLTFADTMVSVANT